MPAAKPATARLTALRILDPDAFARTVRAALEAAGSVPEAAESLGIPPRTLWRWAEVDASLLEGMDLRGPGRNWDGVAMSRKNSARQEGPAGPRHSPSSESADLRKSDE